MGEEETALDELLSIAEENLDNTIDKANKLSDKSDLNVRKLTETDLFSQEAGPSCSKVNESVVHKGDTDSSDDEDNKYYQESKYTEYGRQVKQLLTTNIVDSKPKSNPWKRVNKQPVNITTTPKVTDCVLDPTFGIRIINPLISSKVIQERMVNREAIPFSRLKAFSQSSCKDKDWVLAGVVTNKMQKTSQTGKNYCIWNMTDLKDDIKSCSVFLFSSANKEFWKTAIGTVVGILNPSVLEKRDSSKDEAVLSVDNPQRIMILGQSKDYGVCKSKKKSGEQCTAVVNTSRCEFCIYHIKQEYQKCSKRSELQSSFAGQGLVALRNKVLGKNEVFYAGKSYMAIPSKRSKKQEKRDEARISLLNGTASSPLPKQAVNRKKKAAQLEVSVAQRKKDLEMLKKLGGIDGLDLKNNFTGEHSPEVTLQESKNTAASIINKLKEKQSSLPEPIKSQYDVRGDLLDVEGKSTFSQKESNSISLAESKNTALSIIEKLKGKQNNGSNLNKVLETVPKLTFGNGLVDLNTPVKKSLTKAKMDAIKFIRANPLQKVDPNSVKSVGKKRPAPVSPEEKQEKKAKVETSDGFRSERFKKMMMASSKHGDLIKAKEDEDVENYFSKLEKKEMMEEKMVNTYKIACKAVKCLRCKYVNFSAAELCKKERHPLKVFDAVKRFFKCGDCGNRTISLSVVPLEACKKCGGGKWEKTGMMKEKVVGVKEELSIRGGEQAFVNSVATNSNINLLVPDE